MNQHQQTAFEHHCRLAVETANPGLCWLASLPNGDQVSIVLSLDSGYE